MAMQLIQFDELLKSLHQERPLEENLSKIIREIENEFSFLSLGIFLKVPKSEIYRLKISRNISHKFAKNTIFTKGDPLIDELLDFKMLILDAPGRYMMEHEYKQLVIIPIFQNNELLGFLFINKKESNFNSEELTHLSIFSSIISFTVNTYVLESKMDHQYKEFELTRVYSYQAFLSKANSMFSLLLRYQRDLTISVIKIGNFDKVIRTIGEQETNVLINDISRNMANNLRETDLIGKLHKDTLAIVMPETSEKNAIISLKRIKKTIDSISKCKVCKIGYGVCSKDDSISTVDQLIAKAEQAAVNSVRIRNEKIMSCE